MKNKKLVLAAALALASALLFFGCEADYAINDDVSSGIIQIPDMDLPDTDIPEESSSSQAKNSSSSNSNSSSSAGSVTNEASEVSCYFKANGACISPDDVSMVLTPDVCEDAGGTVVSNCD